MKTPFIHMVAQRHDWDCGVAALAMFLGVEYEAALLAYGDLKVMNRGVWFTEITRAAAHFGVTLRKRRKYDFDRSDGILHIRFKRSREQHVLLLREGWFWDTNHYAVWAPEDYLTENQATAGILLEGSVK